MQNLIAISIECIVMLASFPGSPMREHKYPSLKYLCSVCYVVGVVSHVTCACIDIPLCVYSDDFWSTFYNVGADS